MRVLLAAASDAPLSESAWSGRGSAVHGHHRPITQGPITQGLATAFEREGGESGKPDGC